jgi:hypothetical protein
VGEHHCYEPEHSESKNRRRAKPIVKGTVGRNHQGALRGNNTTQTVK